MQGLFPTLRIMLYVGHATIIPWEILVYNSHHSYSGKVILLTFHRSFLQYSNLQISQNFQPGSKNSCQLHANRLFVLAFYQ
jgi:hypothetical protein